MKPSQEIECETCGHPLAAHARFTDPRVGRAGAVCIDCPTVSHQHDFVPKAEKVAS